MRALLTILIAAALVAGGWWILNRPESDADHDLNTASEETGLVETKPTPTQTASRAVRSIPFQPRGEIPAPASGPAETPDKQPAAATDGVRGVELQVVVIDEFGHRLESEDGVLSLMISPSVSATATEELPITAGRAHLKVLPNLTVILRKGTMGGRIVNSPGLIDPPPTTGPWVLELSWLYPFRVRVQDAQSKLDLKEVQVRQITDSQFDDMWHPGAPLSGMSILRDGNSPLELPANEQQPWLEKLLWVGATGYAWTRIKAFHTGAEGVVLLEPGGDLELTLEGKTLPSGYSVRLRHFDGRLSRGGLWAQSPIPETNHCVFSGLKPGRYMVSVERGAWYDNPSAAATSEVQVRPGTIAKATLLIEETIGELRPTHITGIVRVAPLWH